VRSSRPERTGHPGRIHGSVRDAVARPRSLGQGAEQRRCCCKGYTVGMQVAIATSARPCTTRVIEPALVNAHSGALSRKSNECFRFDGFSPRGSTAGGFLVVGEVQHSVKDLRSWQSHRRCHLATCATHPATQMSTQGGRHEHRAVSRAVLHRFAEQTGTPWIRNIFCRLFV
jgi:hypothetical protein